jgi:hypothetical protein
MLWNCFSLAQLVSIDAKMLTKILINKAHIIYRYASDIDGIVLELGAYNGILHSESLAFENFGWGRILIEGIKPFNDPVAI